MKEPLNLLELEDLARERLPRMAFDYYASGAGDESCLRRNRQAMDRWILRHRVLVDVSRRDLSTTVLGERLSMPVAVAPTAFHRLAHADGELATVRAAGAAGTLFILSTLSNTAVEEVVAAASGPVWFQVYCYKDRGATKALLERAREAGARALVLTVDTPLLGRRERDVRNRFHLPEGLAVENLTARGLGDVPTALMDSGLAAYVATLLDQSLTWKDLEWMVATAGLPVLVKGVVRGDDAERAVQSGAAGIVVSNHGGRQLDASPATLDALPEVAEAVAGRAEVLVDGGFRRGVDILKALALGANAVLIGRPVLWGLAVAGEEGVRSVLEMLRAELDLAMALCGCPTLADVTRDLAARSDPS